MITVLYWMAIEFLVWEYKNADEGRRRELETVPLILAGTALYLVAVVKTQHLALMFGPYMT